MRNLIQKYFLAFPHLFRGYNKFYKTLQSMLNDPVYKDHPKINEQEARNLYKLMKKIRMERAKELINTLEGRCFKFEVLDDNKLRVYFHVSMTNELDEKIKNNIKNFKQDIINIIRKREQKGSDFVKFYTTQKCEEPQRCEKNTENKYSITENLSLDLFVDNLNNLDEMLAEFTQINAKVSENVKILFEEFLKLKQEINKLKYKMFRLY